MPFHHELTFGDAEHLPHAEALTSIAGTWHDHNLLTTQEHGGSSSIARLPDHPEAVVRIHRATAEPGDEIAYEILARSGIRHFTQMTEAGLYVPPQRFVIAPTVFKEDSGSYLYSFTDLLEGETLDSGALDPQHAAAIVDSLAKYLSWVHTSHEPDFLWDKVYSWQFTLLKTGQVVLHDVGLDFEPAWTGRAQRKPSKDMYVSSVHLEEWSQTAGIDMPQSLRQHIRAIEPWPRRLIRRALSKLPS